MTNILKGFFFASLIYTNLRISSCQSNVPTVPFGLNETDVLKFPWMTVICRNNFKISYGSLVHSRAVLTLDLPEIMSGFVNLTVHGDCFFQGGDILFLCRSDCPEYRNVTVFNILDNYQVTNKNKLVILSFSKPFVFHDTMKLIKLNKWDRRKNDFDCGIVSVRTLKTYKGELATLFSLIHVVMYNRTIIHPFYTVNISHFFLYNSIDEEVYDDSRYFELDYPGSPLVCRTTNPKRFQEYVLVGVVNLTFKKYSKRRNKVVDGRFFGEIVRIDDTVADMNKLFKQIANLA